MAYNNSIPNATDLISNSQSQIKANFQAIDGGIGSAGVGPGFSRNHYSLASTLSGLHYRVDFGGALTSPTISGFVSSLYPKKVTNVEAFYKNASADMQITNSLLTTASGQGMMPGGLQIRAGLRPAGAGSTVTYTLPFPVDTISVTCTSFGSAAAVGVAGTVDKLGFGFTGNNQFYWIAIGY